MPFKKKKFRTKLEARLDDLASQTEELRQQVVDRAPGVRDQLVDMLPDKDQLRDLRDDLFERLPDGVAEKVPDKVKPKKTLEAQANRVPRSPDGRRRRGVRRGQGSQAAPRRRPSLSRHRRLAAATPPADVTPPKPAKKAPPRTPERQHESPGVPGDLVRSQVNIASAIGVCRRDHFCSEALA